MHKITNNKNIKDMFAIYIYIYNINTSHSKTNIFQLSFNYNSIDSYKNMQGSKLELIIFCISTTKTCMWLNIKLLDKIIKFCFTQAIFNKKSTNVLYLQYSGE
jgi:hypothetical protein